MGALDWTETFATGAANDSANVQQTLRAAGPRDLFGPNNGHPGVLAPVDLRLQQLFTTLAGKQLGGAE